jgi:hypothetical protein
MSQIWMGNADLIGCKMGIVKTQILNMRKNTKKKGICIVFSFSKNLFFKDFQKKMIVFSTRSSLLIIKNFIRSQTDFGISISI